MSEKKSSVVRSVAIGVGAFVLLGAAYGFYSYREYKKQACDSECGMKQVECMAKASRMENPGSVSSVELNCRSVKTDCLASCN
jgi:hypothetical protein